MLDAPWWRAWRMALALLLALAIAVVAFAFRFNSLSGTLGGFDDDHFATLMRVDLLLDGQQPLRDFADFELRGAWPSLSYEVPAWAQRIGGRTLLSEAYLTVGALALAHAVLFVVALALSRRWSVALLAAVLAIVTTPKLYNYPKVLVLTLGVLAIRALARSASWSRLALAAAVTAMAVLFRHDYGVYVAFGILAALATRDVGDWRRPIAQIGSYVGLTTVFLLPSILWVQAYAGIPSYLRKVAETATLEAQRTELRLSSVAASGPQSVEATVVLTYYGFWVVAVAALAVLIVRRRFAGTSAEGLTNADRATAVGLLAMVALVNLFFLRANLTQRFADAVIPVAALLSWGVGSATAIGPVVARRLTSAALGVLLIALVGASAAWSGTARRLEDAGLLDSWQATTARFRDVRDNLRGLPPVDWSHVEMGGTLPASRYVAQCTAPDDYLLVAGYAPEIYVMARRRFAAGQGTISLGFYTSNEDQERALARLSTQSVPIILAEAEEFDDAFASDYPLLARHLLDHYRDAGTIDLGGEAGLRVFVERTRTPTGVDPHLGLPCFN